MARKADRVAASGIERSQKANELELPEQNKGQPLGMVPGDAAEKPVVALRPAGMTLPSFIAGKQVKAGKKEMPTQLAQTKASAAEPPAKVTAERAASKANEGHLSDRLLSLSAGKCRICAAMQLLHGVDKITSISLKARQPAPIKWLCTLTAS